MPSHTPAERQKNVLAPPPEFINPLMLPDQPQQQGAINPLLEEVLASRSAQPGASGPFAGSPTQQGIAAGGASFSADLDVASRGGLTPSFIQSLGKSLQAGNRAFAAAKEDEAFARDQQKVLEADQERRVRLVDALDSTGTKDERVKALRKSLIEFAGNDQPEMVDAIQNIIDAENPDESFTTLNLGDGFYATTNDNTGDVVEGGTRTPGDEELEQLIGRPPGATERLIGWYLPSNPTEVLWTKTRADQAKVDKAGGEGSTKIDSKLALQGLNLDTGLEGYLQLFNNVDLDAPFNPQDFVEGPGAIRQPLIQSKNPVISAVAKAFSSSRQEGFAFANDLAKEAIGRIASGAVINQGELATFRAMLPAPNDDPRVTFIKLRWMRDFNEILKSINANEALQTAEQRGHALRNSDIWVEGRNRLRRARTDGGAPDAGNVFDVIPD